MMKIVLVACFLAITMSASHELAANGPLKTEQIFEALGFSEADRKRLMDGDFVSRTLDSSNEHELIVAFAFHVRLSPDKLHNEIKKRPLMAIDPAVISWSAITGNGSLKDFRKLNLSPGEKKRARRYLNAKPSEDLNLDKDEIASFNAIKTTHDQSAVTSVTEAVRAQLLARFQAYHQSGLSGISSYERNQQNISAGLYLKNATEAYPILQTILPDFYKALLNYPKDKPDGLEEEFVWTKYKVEQEPAFTLSHHMRIANSDVFVNVHRQFYVSNGYNAGQSISALIPVDKGSGTIVFYVNRVFSDNLSGFGSSVKKAIGSEIMIAQLKELFRKARIRVEKNAK